MIPVTATGASRTLIIAFSTTLAVVATTACGSADSEFAAPVDVDTYVTAMAELSDLERFPPPGSDEAARAERADSARRDILERHGVTADELLAFAEAAGAQPHRMVEIMDRIVEVSDSLARRRTGAGRAADSAAAAAAGSDSVRDAGLLSDSAADPSADSTADTTTPSARDSLPLRQRLREMRERADDARRPAP